MVNIILDTNTWIYLANGFDQSKNTHNDGLKVKLLGEIQQLLKTGKIRLFTNDIVLDEWKRNQSARELYIEKKKAYLESEKNRFSNMKKKVEGDAKIKIQEASDAYESAILEEIKKDQEHIKAVEDLLFNQSENIPIQDKNYIEAAKLAVGKKPPFHKKGNSFGDAVILLSSVDFFEDRGYDWIKHTIFVSNNSEDFCVAKGSNEVHPDLQQYFGKGAIAFELNIALALGLSKDIVLQIQEYHAYIDSLEPCLADCKGQDYGTNLVIYDEIEIFDSSKEKLVLDSSQIQLDLGQGFVLSKELVELANKQNSIKIEVGNCMHCNATHVRCSCGSEHYEYDSEFEIECSCGLTLCGDKDGKSTFHATVDN